MQPQLLSLHWLGARHACIGATTIEEYRKSIEKDGAMDRFDSKE